MITLEEQQLREHLAIDEITFAIPAQSFGISCSISAEEALPVVTEFALRIAYVCGTLSPEQLQDFFGFSKKETEAVLNSLLDERLLKWNDDHLELTSYALARFEAASSDNLPRFFKIQDWSAEVVFDLISFNPAGRPSRLKRVHSQVELAMRNTDKQSRTKQYAEQSFQQNFRQICNKEKAEIYKVSAIDAGERFSIPLPCTFHLDLDGQTSLRRDIDDESFGNRLEITEAITDALASHERRGNERLREFIQTFDGTLLQRYVTDESFDLRRYVEDVHLSRLVRPNDDRVVPMLGAMYLPRNAALLTERIKAAMSVADPEMGESPAKVGDSGIEDQQRTPASKPTAALWWAPQSSLWARTRSAKELAKKIDNLLQPKGENSSSAGVYVTVQKARQSPKERLFMYQYHFDRLLATDAALMDGSLELLIVPDTLVCAMFHFHLAHQAVAVPIGYVSSVPEHVAVASQLVSSRLKPHLDSVITAHDDESGALLQGLIHLVSHLTVESEASRLPTQGGRPRLTLKK